MKLLLRRAWPVAGLAVALLASSCGRNPQASSAEPEWIARVNGEPITAADVQFEVRRRTEARQPAGDAESILQDLIRRKVMLHEAAKSEVMRDPAVRRELENRQLGQWLDRSLQVKRDAVRVSDDEMKAYYEAHRDAFSRPAMARLAILYRRANAGDEAELREELAKGRAAFLADPAAATQQGRIPGFGTVAAAHSEDTISRYRGGDLGWIDATQDDARHPAAVLEAARALDVGGVSDVIPAGEGLYVVMKIDQRAPAVSPYEEVAPTLRRKLIRLKQEEVEQSFTSNLMAGAKIEVDREKAARIAVPAADVAGLSTARPPAELSPGSGPSTKPESTP